MREPRDMTRQHVGRVEPPAFDQRLGYRFRAMAVSSVVVPGGSPIDPSSNAGRGTAIWRRASELERGSQRVPHGETEHASRRLVRTRSIHVGILAAQAHRRRSRTQNLWYAGRPHGQKIGPKHKMCRRVGEPLCGRPNCPSNKRPYPPGQHGRGRKRISEYQTRLVEKQKLRAIYGVSPKPRCKRYYEKASNSMDVTGEELIRQLETRLDTVILRLGFALTTRQARQLVSHGHVRLDGKRINVPSARVRPEQTDRAVGQGQELHLGLARCSRSRPTRPATSTGTRTTPKVFFPACRTATRARSRPRSKSASSPSTTPAASPASDTASPTRASTAPPSWTSSGSRMSRPRARPRPTARGVKNVHAGRIVTPGLSCSESTSVSAPGPVRRHIGRNVRTRESVSMYRSVTGCPGTAPMNAFVMSPGARRSVRTEPRIPPP